MAAWNITNHIPKRFTYGAAEIRKIARRVFNAIKRRTPVRTGHLKNGWELVFEREGGVLNAYAVNEVEYVEYVENGTPKMRARRMVARTLSDLRDGDYT